MAGRLDPLEVLLLREFAQGRPLHETAGDHHYSHGYLRRRRSRLIRRLGSRSMGGALVKAINEGLLTEETVHG